MTGVREDIAALEARLRAVELGPDARTAAVVTCLATFEAPHVASTLEFLRVWARQNPTWQISAWAVSE